MAAPPRPPRLAQALLRWLMPDAGIHTPLGDFQEWFEEIAAAESPRAARRWYRRQVLDLLLQKLAHLSYWSPVMLNNYVKMALRQLGKRKGFAFLNILGLAVGLACFVVIARYVQDEYSYDRFHANADRIYRLLDFRKVGDIGEESSSAPLPTAEALLTDFPEQLEAAVRFFNFQAPSMSLAYAPERGAPQLFNETRLFFTDPAVFEVFDFPLAQGNPATALAAPHTLVLTEAMAQKYFGDANPLGKTLLLEDQHELTVTGVLADLPSNVHFQFDFLVSFATLDDPAVMAERLRHNWIWNPAWTYLLLDEQTDPVALEAAFPAFVQRHFHESRRDRVKLYLQPLTSIHLHSNLDYEIGPNSDVAYLYIFSAVAVFILLIACINFINLSTARSTQRAREIGMRKVFGAYRGQLIRQFLGETMVLSLLAMLLALPLIGLMLPVLNALSGKALTLSLFADPWLLLGLPVVALGVGVLAGLYPAFYLSSYRPAEALKGEQHTGRRLRAERLRQALVVGQFALSTLLIVATLVATRQLDLLQNRQLGFEKEQVVLLPVLRAPLMQRYDAFKDALLQDPHLHAVTTVEAVPGVKHQTGSYLVEGETERQQFARLVVHDDFAAALGIEMVAGRDFLPEFAADANSTCLINEAMVRHLGWGSPEEALGKTISGDRVVGVMQDFHFASLHRPIGPFVVFRVPDDPRALSFSARYLAVRIDAGAAEEALAALEALWGRYETSRPFEYLFLDQQLNTQYLAESRLRNVAGVFAGLAVLLACLGLLGLASFTAERRTREIGIRKVLGATVPQLLLLLGGAFLRPIGLAIAIAVPAAYFLLNHWLQSFPYRVEVGVATFVGAALLVLLIACATLTYHAVKAAFSNPVDSLQHE